MNSFEEERLPHSITLSAIERLARLKNASDCIKYFENIPIGRRQDLRLTIYGSHISSEVYVEVTDGIVIRVKSFASRHKDYPFDARRTELPLVDIADAHALARAIARHWPWRHKIKGNSKENQSTL